MPHHKSAEKRVRTNEKSRVRNIAARSRMRAILKAVRDAKTAPAGKAAYAQAVSVLDRTVAKGIIKKETANRHKARLALFAAKLPA
jgi:small subunit ribosomal protein S20